MYFADDDNVYDLRVFEEARSVTRVGVWPVGLVGIYSFSSPVVKNDAGNGTFHVVGFIDPWFGKRKFPLDMAGFAVSVDYMLKQEANGKISRWDWVATQKSLTLETGQRK